MLSIKLDGFFFFTFSFFHFFFPVDNLVIGQKAALQDKVTDDMLCSQVSEDVIHGTAMSYYFFSSAFFASYII